MMRKTIQTTLALLLLCLSLSLLLWGFSPTEYEIRRQPVRPTEMQLPTPQGSLPLPQETLVAVFGHFPL